MNIKATPIAGTGESPCEKNDALTRATLKVTWRLLPFLFICYFFAYLDRVNVGFAKLQMLSDLKMSDAVYGLGAGVFFLGYFLFEVPSNLILHKVGARKWIARIMISWGLISASFFFVNSPTTFYVLRFLLGIAEAGFFPGILLYLTLWYPASTRGKITAMFMVAIPISGVIGAPLSGWILDSFSGAGGYAGWRWLFLIEGVPSIFLGFLVLYFLTNSIDAAKWLTVEDKSVLKQALSSEHKETHSFAAALRDSRVWLMAFIYFTIQAGVYAISFWLPTFVKGAGYSTGMAIGLATAVPYLVASVVMPLLGKSADRRQERRFHLMLPMAVGALGLMGAAYFPPASGAGMFSLVLATTGMFCALPLFWPIPSAFLGGRPLPAA